MRPLALIAAASVVGLGAVASGVSERVYMPVPVSLADTVLPVPLPDGEGGCVVEVTAAQPDLREGPGVARDRWGLRLTGESDTLTVELRHENTDFGSLTDRRVSSVSLSCGAEVLKDCASDLFEGARGDFNTLSVAVADSVVEVSGGGNPEPLFSVPIKFQPRECEIWMAGALEVVAAVSERLIAPQQMCATAWTPASVDGRLDGPAEPVEGIWVWLDRENDPKYARPGGRYTLAVVKAPDGEGFDILYLDGAQTRSALWEPYMRKGRLRPTVFAGHYDLEWVDADFSPIYLDIFADLDPASDILTLSFPLLHTRFRFSRRPRASE